MRVAGLALTVMTHSAIRRGRRLLARFSSAYDNHDRWAGQILSGFAVSTTFVHFAMSLTRRSGNISGEVGLAIAPTALNRSMVSGSASTAAFIVFTNSFRRWNEAGPVGQSLQTSGPCANRICQARRTTSA